MTSGRRFHGMSVNIEQNSNWYSQRLVYLCVKFLSLLIFFLFQLPNSFLFFFSWNAWARKMHKMSMVHDLFGNAEDAKYPQAVKWTKDLQTTCIFQKGKYSFLSYYIHRSHANKWCSFNSRIIFDYLDYHIKKHQLHMTISTIS